VVLLACKDDLYCSLVGVQEVGKSLFFPRSLCFELLTVLFGCFLLGEGGLKEGKQRRCWLRVSR